jgi:hypothetical protein
MAIPEKKCMGGLEGTFFFKPITHLITFHYGTITHTNDF